MLGSRGSVEMVIHVGVRERWRQGGLALVVAAILSLAMAASAFGSFVQQTTLSASDGLGHSGIGSAVALSGDGNTALVGGPADNGGIGAGWVFVRNGSKWTKLAKLTGTSEVGNGAFGTSVALSSDGKTALIGGPADNGGVGAAWVFTRSGNQWTQRGSKLAGSGEVVRSGGTVCGYDERCFPGQGRFGESVALSSDGMTAVIGGPGDSENDGAAWVFARSGSTWTQQGGKLTGGGEQNFNERFFHEEHVGGGFGESVAISADGNTALIGGPRDDSSLTGAFRLVESRGAVWVFTRSGSTWTQQGSKLTADGGTYGGLRLGNSVALSANGDTALSGAPYEGANEPESYPEGAAFEFTRTGSTWTLGEELQNREGSFDERYNSHFGISLGLSSLGNVALIAKSYDYPGSGFPPGAWAFTRSNSKWSQQGGKLQCGAEGCDVAVSGDASTALVGTAVYVDAPGLPSITSVAPNRSPEHSDVLVTITGSGFTKATAIHFGSTRATSFTVNSDSSITAVSPAEAVGAVDVTVTNRKGTSVTSEGDRFSYVLSLAVNPPTVENGQASPVTRTSETLNATVNPNGAEVSDCHSEYGTTTSYGSAVPCTSLPRGSTPVARIAAGGYHTLAVTSSGRLYAFGFNSSGQLGFETASEATPKPTPVPLPGASGPVTQVAAGTWFSLAITSTGQLYAFGQNFEGQLGIDPNLSTSNQTPTLVALPGATGPVTQIAAGQSHSLALTSTGQLYAFGSNLDGQLGLASNSGTSNPNPTPTLVTLPGATGPVAQVAAGGNHSFALTSTGQLYAFGNNGEGQLGIDANVGTSHPNPTPTLVTLPGASGSVTQISTGESHTLAVTSTGQLYAFGYNAFGQLGNTTNINTLNPNPTPTLVTLPGASGPVTEGSAGYLHSLAITSTGQLYAFGRNSEGQLGSEPTSERNPTPTLVALPGATGPVIQTAAGESFSLAITSTGQLYAFGDNGEGQLGIDANFATYNPNPTPRLVAFPGESPLPVSGSLAGLKANTTYHFRVVATNAGGTSYGADETFMTLP
jgi:alpha-tubulin suppressor-like RCC1 family protein